MVLKPRFMSFSRDKIIMVHILQGLIQYGKKYYRFYNRLIVTIVFPKQVFSKYTFILNWQTFSSEHKKMHKFHAISFPRTSNKEGKCLERLFSSIKNAIYLFHNHFRYSSSI